MLEEKIREAAGKGRVALIPFLTACFPDRPTFWKSLEELDDSGADIIEIGVPFSDPVADGPVVEEASRRALENGANLEEILQGLRERKGRLKAPVVLMGYYNPFLQFGLDKLAEDAKEAGIGGFIVPDLPHEESGPMKAALSKAGIPLIPLVGLNTSEERMKLYADDTHAYVYVVSVMGVTGQRERIAPDVAALVRRCRAVFKAPLALGFGLSRPDQLEALPADARPDAAVFGSALLKHLDEGKSAREFMENWL